MKLFVGVLITIVVGAVFLGLRNHSDKKKNITLLTKTTTLKKDKVAELSRLKLQAHEMIKFNKKGNYNHQYCFLIDMHQPSGTERFFVFDLQKDSVLDAGLVAHGSGSDNGDKDLIFSNTINSNCTSLGKYKIGNSYYGKFGLAYKLHGLDKSNSNAFNRFVVLHAHSCIPESEVAPAEICRSWGCPTVSPAFLAKLKSYIDQSKSPVLLNIFY